MVVHDERNTGGAAKRQDEAGERFDFLRRVPFGAELHEVRAAGEEGGGGIFGVFRGDVAEVENGVEEGGQGD